MKPLHKGLLGLAVLVLLGIVAAAAVSFGQRQPDRDALLEAGIVLLPQPREIPKAAMVDLNGQPFDLAKPDPRWTLVFFGYTFCPDICPTTLAELKQIVGQLPAETARQLRVLMVTVDPARDSPARLQEYLAYFDPAFLGVTGEMSEIQSLSNALGIPFVPGDTRREHYTVDHSGNLAVVGPDGRLHGFVRAPLKVPALVEHLPTLVAGPPAR